MEYFGTNLTEAGHYRWDIDEGFRRMNYSFKELPFNPEEINNNMPNGETVFYQGGGLTVLGITGSCIDRRPGCKSVFWVKGIITREEIIKRIMTNKTAVEIIAKMPFKVKW